MGAHDHGGSLALAPATVAYTSYMQSLALRGGPLEIMAVPPAVRVELRRDRRAAPPRPPEHPVYGGWIDYFSLPANVEMVAGCAPTSTRSSPTRR